VRCAASTVIAGAGGVVQVERGGNDIAVGGNAAEIEAQQGIVAAIAIQLQSLVLAVVDAVLRRRVPVVAADPGVGCAAVAIKTLLQGESALTGGWDSRGRVRVGTDCQNKEK